MKFTASKTIEIVINGTGRYNLPDVQTIRDKKVNTIIPVAGQNPLVNTGAAITYTQMANMFFSATSNGTDYFIQNRVLAELTQDNKKGLYEEIERTISVYDCYIDVTTDITGVLVLTIFYEDLALSNSTSNTNSDYYSFETPILASVGFSSLPDVRTIADKKFKNLLLTFPTTTPLGNTGIGATYAQYGYISLVRGSQILSDRLPLALLLQLQQYEMLEFNNIMFDCDSSFIENAPTTTLFTGDVYLLLTAKYER